jgi:hypothetical protein
MHRPDSSLLERFRVALGYYALVAALVALCLLLTLSASWFETGVLVAIGAVAAVIYRLAVGKAPRRWAGAPKNTQLQQPPPAIVLKKGDLKA